ncbi:hypothetical protein HZH66_002542 [Vespula vulgaris]|uniref:Uncharacterized protein n=1 Tax=Vespula vulgaris TaxID=7454 RepID=A0A834NGC3_VESVU|nr:hypothetical protein HZH66_002542 [Vespula vulgaris]
MSAITLLRNVVVKQIFYSLVNSTPLSFEIQPTKNRWKLLKLSEPGIPGKSYSWIRVGSIDLNERSKEEKVLQVFKDGCKTSLVAPLGSVDDLKYILTTENMNENMMKPIDIIKTHKGILRNPVKANEGDAYPLGALPIGTVVNCAEKYPGFRGSLIHLAGTSGMIISMDGLERTVVQVHS